MQRSNNDVTLGLWASWNPRHQNPKLYEKREHAGVGWNFRPYLVCKSAILTLHCIFVLGNNSPNVGIHATFQNAIRTLKQSFQL